METRRGVKGQVAEVMVTKSIISVLILSAFMVKGVAHGEAKFWDTGKHYTHENPMWVPSGTRRTGS